MLRNPLHPARDPAAYRPADEPGDAAGENDGGDLDQIGKDENFIEQMPLEQLEIRIHVLPNCDRVDPRLPAADGLVPQDRRSCTIAGTKATREIIARPDTRLFPLR